VFQFSPEPSPQEVSYYIKILGSIFSSNDNTLEFFI